MAFKDNREFVTALKETRDVVVVERQVDWDLEAGAIIRYLNEKEGPAVLFTNVKDYPGHKIFGSPLGTFRRLAIALGLPPETSRKEIQDYCEKLLKKPIKPVIVKDGPCKENIIQGDDIDLYEFPAPMIHDGDGGRYIGTWHIVIEKDPDTDWVNWGMYRLHILGKRTMIGLVGPWQNQGQIFYKQYLPKRQNMPFAAAIGVDPISSFVAATFLPPGWSEVDYAGGLRQEPVELIKCETNDLYIPVHAEIVLEGEVLWDMRAEEGPFGEFVGYRAGPCVPMPVFQVNAVTYRNSPILTMTCMGVPLDDSHVVMSVSLACMIKRRLWEARIPFVEVNVLPYGALFLAIISVRKVYEGIANQVSHIASQGVIPDIVIVTEDDIDIFDTRQVWHAIATKCHPIRGIRKFEGELGIPLAPYLSPKERHVMKGGRVVLDCTWPLDWDREKEIPPRSSLKNIYPEEIRTKILNNWKSYGFSD